MTQPKVPIQRMYQSQMPAYQSYSQYKPKQTDSTPTNPPKFTPCNIIKASEQKNKIISNLPKKCSHCKKQLTINCYDEFNGNVMIYCRVDKGCGKSQVLFVKPDIKIPIYEKVCVFEKQENENENEPNVKFVYYLVFSVILLISFFCIRKTLTIQMDQNSKLNKYKYNKFHN